MRYKIGLLIALLLAMASPSQAQLIREELIPASITRDSEIVPTGVANALCITNPGPTFNVAFCSTVDVTGKTVLYKIPEFAFASIPAGTPLVVVTNSASSAVCDGSGATKVVCWWNGTAWTPLGSGGGGAGTGDIESVTAGTGMTGGGTTGALTLNVAGTAPITVAADAVECPTCATTAAALTANFPVIGAGGNATAVGTRSGNTTQFASVTGTKTTSMQLAFDANGNVIASASGIGVGFSGLTTDNLPKASSPTGPLVPSSVSEDADTVNFTKPLEVGSVGTNSYSIDSSAVTGHKVGTVQNTSDTFVYRATTDDLTNKTLDCEGTGNVCITTSHVSINAGVCNNATPAAGFDLPTANAPTPTCFGTTTTQGTLAFADGSTQTASRNFDLPSDWVGAVDVNLRWFANAASANAVRWSVEIGCVADSEAVSTGPSYNTASASNTAYTGTANQRKTTSFTGISMTNCTAGESAWLRVSRVGADGGDTLAAVVQLLQASLKIRRSQ